MRRWWLHDRIGSRGYVPRSQRGDLHDVARVTDHGDCSGVERREGFRGRRAVRTTGGLSSQSESATSSRPERGSSRSPFERGRRTPRRARPRVNRAASPSRRCRRGRVLRPRDEDGTEKSRLPAPGGWACPAEGAGLVALEECVGRGASGRSRQEELVTDGCCDTRPSPVPAPALQDRSAPPLPGPSRSSSVTPSTASMPAAKECDVPRVGVSAIAGSRRRRCSTGRSRPC